jgi:membrane protein DedA with SNARE-associated domain
VQPSELTGILGWAERVMLGLGEWGVGLLTMLETVFPPIPSEVVLPLAGFLSSQNKLSIPLVLVTSTLGAYLGALALYALAARFGQDRSIRLLSRLPLVDREDLERAGDWFSRHGKGSIFFGRLIPGVRSLISLPAGAQRMNIAAFSACTIAGSGVWNGVLIGLGARGSWHPVRTGPAVLTRPQLRGVRRARRPGRLAGRAPDPSRSSRCPFWLTEPPPALGGTHPCPTTAA